MSKEQVNHPDYYNKHPSGVECIDIVRHFNFNLGNAIKYVWRAGLKTKDKIKDLEKANWYINDEINRLLNEQQEKEEREKDIQVLINAE